ncbi:MAG TPA: hypothetical protein V6D10_07370 [Trichocoleus sp.]|jgi:hypothetical protein
MTTLVEMLKRWAELEPDRCSLHRHIIGGLHVLASAGHWLGITQDEIDWSDYARTQVAVQYAIVSRNLQATLENTAHIWLATVKRPITAAGCPYLACATDTEPALALLKAYINSLEHEQQEATP